MDLYQQVLDFTRTSEHISDWPDFQRVVGRAVVNKPVHWQIPLVACQAAVGSPEAARPVAVALAYLHMAIILIDDLLDEDPRGEHQRSGPGTAANLASAMQATGLECIEHSPLAPAVRQAILGCLNAMLLETARGQYLDAQNPDSEAGYWQAAQTKSAPFFATALQAGGLAAGMPSETAEGLYSIGRLYGEMIQLNDDLADCLAVPPNPDWLNGRLPLPLLYAQSVEHPERERFIALRAQVRDSAAEPSAALEEAQAILIRCGAISYCIHHILVRYNQAAELLAKLPLKNPLGIARLLDEMVNPIRELFAALQVKIV